VLAETKLIAEAWDAAGGYQVGSFAGRRWSEWNGKYRDDVRTFWRGDAGMLSRFATRIAGSDDLYHRDGMNPTKSINFVTCHDGFCLRDLVSYTGKRNVDNREENRDGENHNYSMNCGVEGPTTNEAVLELRAKMCRNFLATLLFSHGVPMLNAGDEMGKTQRGNNNAYCQDNEISWLPWSAANTDEKMIEFVASLTKIRRDWPVLTSVRYGVEDAIERGRTAVCWVGPGGVAPDWHHGKSVGCMMCPANGEEIPARSVFLLFNAHTEAVVYKLPKVPRGNWILLCCTDPKANTWKSGHETVTLPARTVMAFGLPA